MTRHYIRLDSEDFIVYGFSSAFENAQEGDVLICEDNKRHFHLLGKTNPCLTDEKFRLKYKFVGNKVIEVAKNLTNDQKLKNVRNKRDELLKETDFMMLADAPFQDETKKDIIAYRQALRDLPSTIDLESLEFPYKPF